MKSSVLGRNPLVCIVTLLAAAIPMIFTACAGGIVGSANVSQQSSTVKISSITPDSGPETGSTTVLISGTNLAPVNQNPPSVLFGGVAASHITIISPLQLEAVVPSHAAGTVSVQVTTADGEFTTLANGFTYTSDSLAISGISPNSGPADGGTMVTISGSNFQSGMSVSFGGFAASSITVSSSSTIKATTPAHNSGAVTVTVTNPAGQSATLSSGFAFHSVDLVWSAPLSSPVPITGYNVYRALSEGGPFGRLNGSTPIFNTSYSDGTVQGSTTYFYEVKSVDSNGTESVPEGPTQTTIGP